MASPQKRGKRPAYGVTSRLSEPSLPLHLALGWLVVRAYPLNEEQEPVAVFSSTFTASILNIIAREILELSDTPVTYSALTAEVDALVRRETAVIARKKDKLRSRGQVISGPAGEAEKQDSWLGSFSECFADLAEGCAFIDRIEKELRLRINEVDEEELLQEPEPIERRSPLGVFLRGLLITLRKLSFDETAHLSRQVAIWCGANLDGPSRPLTIWSLNRKTAMEDTLDKRSTAMQEYRSAASAGDYSGALSSLRRFYDYQFPAAGRGQHQHALLSIANFHYSTGGLDAARAAIDEAIRVARAEGDKACLRHCISLSSRLSTEMSSQAFAASETIKIQQIPITAARLPKASTPMDELWSIKAALDVGEPVHIAIRRIHLALARYENTQVKPSDSKEPKDGWTRRHDFDLSAWHATQAGLWNMMGSDALAMLHEDMTLSSASTDNDGRLTVLLARAERAAKRAQYDEALSMLLDLGMVDGMSIAEYKRWCPVLWEVLERRARFNDDPETMMIIQSLRSPPETQRPTGPGGPTRDTTCTSRQRPSGVSPEITSIQDEVRDSLRKARKLQDAQAPAHLILPHVLSSIQLSSELGLWPQHRLGIVTFGETLLSMEGAGMARKALREVEAIWDQILGSEDEETIAIGALVLGKAKLDIALDQEDQTDLLDEATDHIRHGLLVATKLESRSMILQATTLLTLMASLGNGKENTELVKQWHSAKEGDSEKLEQRREQVKMIGEIVKLVGVRVAESWR